MRASAESNMPRNFDYADAEPRLYAWWERKGWFKPEVAGSNAEPFVVSMPPPNVTGSLHLGHALFGALEDLMVRYERMRGKAALWLPGTDHAGIATQLQVENMLREEGSSREEVGYEEFLHRTWQWKEEHGGTITRQLRRLGASCDWDRERFTLDDGLSTAVTQAFLTLWEQGLIYRGPRLVNWSPGLQTAVSDLEVESTEEEATLYYFKYPLGDGGHIPVATTRPETILGDTALAVNPADARYAGSIGKSAFVPILRREIPVIGDDSVDMAFGTGALKVTPAHDFNDYEIGQRHKLALVNVLNKDASMNANAGKYAGMDRYDCRDRLWRDMEAAGLAIKTEAYTTRIPRSQRGGEVVEPMMSTQWYVRIQPLAEKAMAAVRRGDIKIVPERYEKVYFHWLENIQDWCISRQLWWGHRIPAWYRDKDGDPEGEIHVGRNPPLGGGWVMEEDVLDTWFSSGLWPFSTLGWPSESGDLERYYPTQVMETGHDILFFWVARMIMMGLWFTDKPPFHTVYLHGLVRDRHGKKFSKSLGNVIDPLTIVDKLGADPLRFTLITSGTPGNDVNLDERRVDHTFRFINKVWQITSFINMNLEGDLELGLPPVEELDLPARWILSRLHRLIANVQHLFDIYQFGEAGSQILAFMWDEFAPYYLEISKHFMYSGTEDEKIATQRVLVAVQDSCLRMLHPFMPFMTEEAWRYIPHDGEALIIADWPNANTTLIDDEIEARMNLLLELVRELRNTRGEYKVDPGKRIKALAKAGAAAKDMAAHDYVFRRLCNVEELQLLAAEDPTPTNAASIVVSDVTLYLPLEGMLDIEAERGRLEGEASRLTQQIAKTQKMLGNDNFLSKAPEAVVQRERDRLADLESAHKQVTERLSSLPR
ncbi:MAG: valine--tRNA ligase [Chloroflexota bacterium]|nr:valine--tRNA ligase [Chloroflexota bacterium]